MFLIDDLLLLPAKTAFWAARKVYDAARQQLAETERSTVAELEALHRELEAGRIDEATFDARETELLDRLDVLRGETEAPLEDAPPSRDGSEPTPKRMGPTPEGSGPTPEGSGP